MTRPLRVSVSDMAPSERREGHFVLDALRATTPIVYVPPDEAELLIFGVFGFEHAGFVGTKIEFTGENRRPRWNACDFSIGHDLIDDDRYLRYPFFASGALWDQVKGVRDEATIPWAEREFCLFLVSHPTAKRKEVFDALSRYRRVVSPGRFLHNEDVPELAPRSGVWRASKLQYQRRFRFTVAYENAAYPGYTTEKITDALVTGGIPIYWGNPEIARDVHPECFIDASDFATLDELVDHVRAVDTDEALAQRYLARKDYLVRPPGEYWTDLVAFLGAAAATVGTRSRAEEQRRATRLRRAALTQRPVRAARRFRKVATARVRRLRAR